MKVFSQFVCIFSLILMTGCLDLGSGVELESNPPPITDPIGVDPPPHTPWHPHDPVSFSSCDLNAADSIDLLWWEQDNNLDIGSGFDHRGVYLGFSPQPALVLSSIHEQTFGSGGAFQYATTGEHAFSAPPISPYGIDRNWQIRLTGINNRLEVRWLITDELLLEVGPTPLADGSSNQVRRHQGSLSPSGQTLITLTCYGSVQKDRAFVTSFDVANGKQGPVTTLDDFPCNWYPHGSMVVPTPDGTSAIVVGSQGSAIHVVDLKTGEANQLSLAGFGSANPPGDDFSDGFHFPEDTVLDVAVHPSGEYMATTSTNGLLRRWSLPDLTAIGEPISVAIVHVNLNTYMPDVISPIAFSPDGQLLAYLAEDGEIFLHDLTSSSVIARLETPEVEVIEDPLNPMPAALILHNTVDKLAFSPDSSALAARYTKGTALYGCKDWNIEGEPTELGIFIDGPTTLTVDEPGTFIATHVGGHFVHGHQFFINDVAVSDMSMDREFEWIPEKPGTFEVTVLIDDGFNTGEASLTLTVE